MSEIDPRPAHIYVEATCYACGELVFSELYRPAVAENWPRLALHYQKQIEAHADECTGKKA